MSASNFDPFERRALAVALAPSELGERYIAKQKPAAIVIGRTAIFSHLGDLM
jgi:hypothetical protein